MKKWFIIGLCLLTSILRADAELKALLNNPKTQKLNSKMIQFYVTHPKTSEYLYEGGKEVGKFLEKYCSETKKLIEKFPQERASALGEKRIQNIEHFLSDQATLTKAGIFLFLGVYDLRSYQDVKSWRDLLKCWSKVKKS